MVYIESNTSWDKIPQGKNIPKNTKPDLYECLPKWCT